ncbi:MAG: hypothetical protein GEU26_18600 [Nitrososphaeraceae archaeon]|nr:hypothetical protein [Nitrososphaeraceae archaeon]
MLTGTILPFVSLITQIFDFLDLTSKLGFSSMALQYGSIINQISPSNILDWILTLADIAGVAAIGLVVAVVYFQSRQRKFAGLIEIFKLLNGKEQREARAMLFEAYRKYKVTGNDSIFDDEFYKEYVNRTISDFNEVGALVKKGLVSTNLFLDVYWNITLRSWNASRIIIQKRRTSRNYNEYMINFEVLASDAEKYKNKRFPSSSVEPF